VRRTALVLGFVLLTGCSDGAGAPVPAAKRVDPQQYAVTICSRLQTWLDEVEDVIGELSDKGQAVLDDRVARKQLLVNAATGVRTRTATALADLDATGYPDVSKGRDFATTLRGALVEADAMFAEAEQVTRQLPTDDKETFFYRGAELTQQIEKGFARVRLTYDLLVRRYAATDMWEGFRQDACRNYDDPLT
jgi:hypothetical protein